MGKKHEFDYDLIVIGSGAAGSSAAVAAAKYGKKVALVEEADKFGGHTANLNDVPIGALLQTTTSLLQAKQAAEFGLRTSGVGYNYPAIRTWKNSAVKKTGSSASQGYFEKLGIATYLGKAHFLSPNELSVGRRHVSAKHFIIATGSKWALPKIAGINEVDFLNPDTIFERVRPPKRLLVVGGGESGVQVAQTMAALGAKVYLCEKAKNLLPRFDKEAGLAIEEALASQSVSVLVDSECMALHKNTSHKTAVVKRGGVNKKIEIDEVVIACGRTANTDLGLENTGVIYNQAGVKVNQHLQTNIRHIFAAGDVLDGERHTLKALSDGKLAAHNAFHTTKVSVDYGARPTLLLTWPGVATAGLTEAECRQSGRVVKVGIAPISDAARSIVSNQADGFVKIIASPRGVVLGATIVAPNAGEMIGELALAVQYGLTAQQLLATPRPFLSWNEAITAAASKLV